MSSRGKVVCVTPHAAIDYVITTGRVRLGSTIRASDSRRFAAGKGNCVAVGVAALGCEVTATGFVGRDDREVFSNLVDENVQTEFVSTLGHTRTNVTVIESDASRETHFQTIGFSLAPHDEGALLAKMRSCIAPTDVVVVSGSLPPGASPDLMKRLVETAKAKCAYVT